MLTSKIVEKAREVIVEISNFLEKNSGKVFTTNEKWNYRVSVRNNKAGGVFSTGPDTGRCQTVESKSIKSFYDLGLAVQSLEQIGFNSKTWIDIKPFIYSEFLYETRIYEDVQSSQEGENFIKNWEWNWVVCVRQNKAFGYFPTSGDMAAYREISV